MSDWREGVTVRDGYLLFWGGWPSQWYKSGFELGGVRYNCCEQWMMAEKARVFGDHEVREKILAAEEPKRQKELGRQVRGFSQKRWDELCREIVFIGNLMKYTHNEELGEALLATGDLVIAEASPYDTIWGIGLSESDPRATDPSQWRGTNWLGQAISEVRDALRKERHQRL